MGVEGAAVGLKTLVRSPWPGSFRQGLLSPVDDNSPRLQVPETRALPTGVSPPQQVKAIGTQTMMSPGGHREVGGGRKGVDLFFIIEK